jgi:hypothetical protein
MRRDHASWVAEGNTEKCGELKKSKKNSQLELSVNHGPSGVRATTVRKGGKATLVVH